MREFDKQNQEHICDRSDNAIDEYIAKQSEDVKPYLKQIRDVIKSALPDAQERISWRMPTFWSKQNIIHFAAYKNHIGIYPGDKAIEFFSEFLTEYKTSKGALQLPYNKPLPLDLIAKMAVWCYETGNHH